MSTLWQGAARTPEETPRVAGPRPTDVVSGRADRHRSYPWVIPVRYAQAVDRGFAHQPGIRGAADDNWAQDAPLVLVVSVRFAFFHQRWTGRRCWSPASGHLTVDALGPLLGLLNLLRRSSIDHAHPLNGRWPSTRHRDWRLSPSSG